MKKYFLPACAAVAAAALIAAGQWGYLASGRAYPPPDALHEVRQSVGGDIMALSLGMRRLAADVWFIRLMQYYGTQSPEAPDEPPVEYGAGKYPEFLPLARHIAALDPYFFNAALFAAGALAFNMHRPEEAVSLLNGVLIYNPKEWKYITLLTAIGYSKAGNPKKVAEIITPLLNEPDCPVTLLQLGAFLNKKAGNYLTAYELYRRMAETSKDSFYVDNAKIEMKKLQPFLGRRYLP